jgi:hypothetical protein
LQYMFARQDGVFIDTKWQEYFVPFADFHLAPWERHKKQFDDTPNISDITAFGWDLKTAKNPISGKIWIDYIRFVDKEGREIVFSDADKKKIIFQNKHVNWMSGWNIHQ